MERHGQGDKAFYLRSLQLCLTHEGATGDASGVKFRSLPDGLDFLLRPVEAGMLRYTDLLSGELTLEDVLLANVYLDNKQYNENALERAMRDR